MRKAVTSDPARTVLLVLGAAVWPNGASPTLQRRCLAAASVWRSGLAAHVVVSGGLGRHPPAEATVMRDLLMARGIPPAVLHVEDRATSTLENIRFSVPILRRIGATHVILVTDLTHGPRALLTARAFGLSASLRAPSVRHARKHTLLYQATRELVALPAYATRLWRIRGR